MLGLNYKYQAILVHVVKAETYANMQQDTKDDKGPRKRKPVEVVVFEEPGRKSKTNRKRLHDEKDKLTEKEDFKALFNDVKEFGITGLSKKERRKIEDEKAQSLGARKQKGQKIPYPILQYSIKVRREREKQKEELEKEMGIFKKKKKVKNESKSAGQGGWWKDEPVQLDSTKNNIKVKASDLQALRKEKK